ncbi:MAG: GAF domain-containing protein [Tepidisphaeraceae bacterium]
MASGANETEDSRKKLWETELQRVNRALRVVNKTNKSLHQVDDVVTWLNQICQSAIDHGGNRMVCVGFAEQDEHKKVRMVASAGFEAGYLDAITITWADEPHGRSPTGIAIRTGRTCIARNIPEDPAFEPWREEITQRGYQSSIALPLISDGRTFGMLGMYADVVDAFGPKEVEVLEELADDLAFGLTVVLRTRAERRAANEALKESQQELAEAQRIAHLGHWERDLKTNVVKWSDDLFRIYGLTPQTRGVHFSEFLERVHGDDRPRIAHMIEDAVINGRHINTDYRIVRTDGQVRFVHSEGDAIRDDAGQLVRTFGVLQDITERHQAEEALENANRLLEAKNTALQEVLANIEAEKNRIGRQITKNVQKIILPLFHSLTQSLNPRQQRRLEQIEHALEEVVSPFIDNVSQAVESLTPTELRICNFVRRGLAAKEIAELEYLSPQTIAAHRRNIRRKLGISNQKINLTIHLRTVFPEEPARR